MDEMNFKEALVAEIKDSSYLKLGLKRNPFLPIPFKGYEIQTFVGRQKESKEFIRNLNDLLHGELPSITIIGGTGIGKTHFLKMWFQVLKEANNDKRLNLNVKIMFVEDFIDFRVTVTELILSYRDKIKIILFIDNAEQIWAKEKELFINIYGKKIKIISSWNARSWDDAKNKSRFWKTPKTKTILLDKMSNDECLSILLKRISLSQSKTNSAKIEEEALHEIIKYGRGIPLTLLTLSEKLMHYVLEKKYPKISKEFAVEFFEKYMKYKQFEKIKEKLNNLSEPQKKILKIIWFLNSSQKRSIDSNEIANELGLSRPAVVVQLKKLVKEHKLLNQEKEGKKVKYSIKPMYFEYIDEFFTN